ncbi:hypothetical protein CY35_07G080700 [Sphagnum magellanicum]|uniref:Uncharacterized protein n=1 Tax=Sphagnum magellanicum TaxID=128215 RepID=A0ACB8HM73_9BRYO|nr:hypothetical protein CY35_07G080700 [Sphagnum magellanicum]
MATMSMMFVSRLVPAKISASSTSASSSSVLSSSSCTSSSSVGCLRTWVHVRSSCSSSSLHQLHHGSLLVPTKRRLFRDSSSSSSFISSSNVCCTTRLGSLVGDKLVIGKRRRIIAPAPPHSRPAGRIIAEQKTDLLRVVGFALRAGKEGNNTKACGTTWCGVSWGFHGHILSSVSLYYCPLHPGDWCLQLHGISFPQQGQ